MLIGFGFSRTNVIGSFDSELIVDDQIFPITISVVLNVGEAPDKLRLIAAEQQESMVQERKIVVQQMLHEFESKSEEISLNNEPHSQKPNKLRNTRDKFEKTYRVVKKL